MTGQLNAAVVLAALDNILELNTLHKGTHLSIMRRRLRKLRNQVAEYVDPPSPDSSREGARAD